MTATKQFREQLLNIFVDQLEGLFKSGSGFPVDLLNSGLKGLQCLFQFLVLGIQVLFALGFDLVLVDGRQVDRPKALDTIGNQLQLLFPVHRI